MKRFFKFTRRTFLILSFFFLGLVPGECSFFNFLWLVECEAPPEVGELNAWGNSPDGYIINVGDGGIIYVPYEVTCDDPNYYLVRVAGFPDLNGITFFISPGIGNIIVGDGGTIIQFDPDNQINNLINPAGAQNLNAIDDNPGLPDIVAVGDGGTVIISTDYGLNWSVINFPYSTNLKECHILGNHITVAGDNYSAYQSFDSGETWEQIGIGDNFRRAGPTSINAIFFYDENVGYIGGTWGLMGKTTDGGANWTIFGAPDFEEITDLFFISPDSGVAVGNPGIVRFTADGGNTWEEDTSITNSVGGRSIKQIDVINEDVGFVLIEGGGTIGFANDSTLLTSVGEDEIPEINYSLSNNYPNPFNPLTIIEYNLPEYGYVTLKVYDMLGREIVTLVNEEMNAGNYEVEFDGSDLASGIYYYKIMVEYTFTETKKMILIK